MHAITVCSPDKQDSQTLQDTEKELRYLDDLLQNISSFQGQGYKSAMATIQGHHGNSSQDDGSLVRDSVPEVPVRPQLGTSPTQPLTEQGVGIHNQPLVVWSGFWSMFVYIFGLDRNTRRYLYSTV